MSMNRTVSICLAALLTGTLCAAPPAPAPETPAARPAPPARWTAGVAGLASRSPYKGDDIQVRAFPALSYRGERLSLLGLTAGYRLTSGTDQPALSAVTTFRFSPYEDDDSPDLDGMHARHATLEGGLRSTWKLPAALELEGEALTDLLAVHDGQRLRVGVGRRYHRGNWAWRPDVGVEWLSPNLTRFLYGVGPDEATATRPAYEPGAAWRTTGNVMLMRTFARDWVTTVIVGGSLTDGAAGDSPIVDKTALWNTVLSVGYQF